MKFGGTSVKDEKAIKRTIEIVKNRNNSAFVVVSALAGITNKLVQITELISKRNPNEANNLSDNIKQIHLDLATQLGVFQSTSSFIIDSCDELQRIIYALDVIGEISNKSKDKILAIGETLSSFIVAEYANTVLLNSKHVDSRELIRTDCNYTSAEVDFTSTQEKISQHLQNHKNIDIFICGGFISSDEYGNTTTLGRGGSDYTAAVIAKCINAEKLEIWTDVDGILTSDPRLIGNAMLIREISYIEAAELAFFGAKVLHPKTIYPAIESAIPVYVLNSYKPYGSGTLIQRKSNYSNMIKAIAFRKNITVINISSNRMLGAYGFLAKVFDVFLMNETSVDLVTTSEVSISLTIDNDCNLNEIMKDLSSFASIEIIPNQAIISVIGEGIRNTTGIASQFFGAVNGINISMISMGASEVNLSIALSENELESAVKCLHNEFFEKKTLPDLFVQLNSDK